MNNSGTISHKRLQRSEAISMPIDLIPDILSRLPVKSIARCRCVSKLWASILSDSKFTEVFLSRSSAKRKLLLICEKQGELFIFSCSQPENPDKKLGSVAATYHMSIPFPNKCYIATPPGSIISSNGFICLRHQDQKDQSKETKLVICNPSTGQSFSFPVVKSLTKTWKGSEGDEVFSGVDTCFGYDPIEKQYKVLSRSWANSGPGTEVQTEVAEYQIMTLGTGNLSWRRIECGFPHIFPKSRICINGVLYIKAISSSSISAGIFCFDLRSEKFISCIKLKGTSYGVLHYGTLVNYNGKLGWFRSGRYDFVGASNGRIELWVLEDAEKQEWSEHKYILPASRQIIGGYRFVGVTRTKQLIVFSPSHHTVPYFLLYYNTEKNTMVRVEIQGMEELSNTCYRVYTYQDHVENLKLMQAF